MQEELQVDTMLALAAVTILGVLEQAYFSLQVIQARRRFSVSPPITAGPPEFERVFRAQANCSEYFPLFIILLWTSGVFFHQGVSAVCGTLYLAARFWYFHGYSQSAQQRLAPLYLSAQVLWFLIGCSSLGVLHAFCRLHLGVDVVHKISTAL